MTDYAKRHKGIAHFGVWADETADAYGARDAMAILAAAIGRTQDDDLRHDRDMLEALHYLAQHAGGRMPSVKAFRAGLDVQHPDMRRKALTDAYRAMARQAGGWIEVGL